jgi:hypothetical protein
MSDEQSMSQKEMTAHIRKRIAKSGITASVRKYKSCGVNWIQVNVTNPEHEFTPCEQNAIKVIAQANGLTLCRGMEIRFDSSTNPQEFNFVLQP